ncbi:hypothetical protein HMN09_00328700 [Mycena chlorophos]|uniref:Uncharacterized protein n=1 Tax=Mycena chlorophos TaxID=658473 RepID=A0A8H6WMW9_MYCCL|nr:hypothetical protein HMN09_00328700 [Mycena chlorophos]
MPSVDRGAWTELGLGIKKKATSLQKLSRLANLKRGKSFPALAVDSEDPIEKQRKTELAEEKRRAADYQSRFYNASKKLKRRDASKVKARNTSSVKLGQEQALRIAAEAHSRAKAVEVDKMGMKLRAAKSAADLARAKCEKKQKENDALQKVKTRRVAQQDAAVNRATTKQAKKQREAHTYHLKNKSGIIPDKARRFVAKLICDYKIPAKNVDAIIHATMEEAGMVVEGSIGRTSMGRLTREAGIAAKALVAQKLLTAKSNTLGSDGSTIRNENIESRTLVTINQDGTRTELSAGVSGALTHKSEDQLVGWRETMADFVEIFSDSPLADSLEGYEGLDLRRLGDAPIWAKNTGLHTDHAPDQKKLAQLMEKLKIDCEREIRGEKAIQAGSKEAELLQIIRCDTTAIGEAGGFDAWSALSEDERQRRSAAKWKEACRQRGEEEVSRLNPEERRLASLWVWAGCCMHKELNATKAGSAGLTAYWLKHNLSSPMKHFNRDNDMARRWGGQAAEHAEAVSVGGADKTAYAAGCIFGRNRRSRAFGQQDSAKARWLDLFGYSIAIPDTSANRFQSKCRVAEILILHYTDFIAFLLDIKDGKESRAFNHMEQNLYNALHCPETLQELAVFALINQAVNAPYASATRGGTTTSHLELGPLHNQLKSHLQKIQRNPELLFGPSATYETATLDGQPWERPEVIYRIQSVAPGMPHLAGLIVSWCEHTLPKWDEFTTEFVENGPIAVLSEEERRLAWMRASNCENEGQLGLSKRELQANPTLTLDIFNARLMHRKNDVGRWLADMAVRDPKMSTRFHAYTRKKARIQASAGNHRKWLLASAKRKRAVVDAKRAKDAVSKAQKQKAADELAAVVPLTTRVAAQAAFDAKSAKDGRIDVPGLRLQLKWYAQYIDINCSAPSGLNRKPAFDKLLECIDRYALEVVPKLGGASEGVSELQLVDDEYSDDEPDLAAKES